MRWRNIATTKPPMNTTSATLTVSEAKSWLASPPMVPSSWRTMRTMSASSRPSSRIHRRRRPPTVLLRSPPPRLAAATGEPLRQLGHDAGARGVRQHRPLGDLRRACDRSRGTIARPGRSCRPCCRGSRWAWRACDSAGTIKPAAQNAIVRLQRWRDRRACRRSRADLEQRAMRRRAALGLPPHAVRRLDRRRRLLNYRREPGHHPFRREGDDRPRCLRAASI